MTFPSKRQKLPTDLHTNDPEDHTINEVRQHLWGLSNPAPCLKQGQLDQVLDNSKDEDFTTYLGNLGYFLTTLVAKNQVCFLYLNLCLLPLIFSLDITEKSLALSCLLLSHTIIETFWIASALLYCSSGRY